MIYWLIVILVVLAGVALGSFLWGMRRQALLRRLHAGIVALMQGRQAPVMQRFPEDDEPILNAFDQLSSQIEEERRIELADDHGRDVEVVLERLVTMLRQPLVAIQSYASLIRQAPDIPSAGDTHDLVQKLHTQIVGLLRLFESSTDVSKLRAAISGLEREVAGILPGKQSRAILLIDEENDWTHRVAQMLRPLRLQVLHAPGADAAAIMARAVQPRALLVNIGRPDGIGWRSLALLRRNRQLLTIPILLYRLSSGGRHASLWVPQDVWFWPLPNNDDSRIVRQRVKSENLRYSLHGNLELATEVSRWLGTAGIQIEPVDKEANLVLEGCVTLAMHPDGAPNTDEDDFVLIIPQRSIPVDLDRLTRSVERQAEKRSTELAEWERTLLQNLRPLADEIASEEVV